MSYNFLKNMIIDTHSHLNFSAFEKDREKVIKDCLEKEIWMINVGTNFETSKKAVEISESFEKGVFAAVGFHPIHLKTDLVKVKLDKDELKKENKEEFSYESYKKLALSKKVVAIGEIGLDFWYRPKTKKKLFLFKEKQKELFLNQLKLAKELKLPLIFHCRLAYDDLLFILKKEEKKISGVIHCFTGNLNHLKEFLKMGFYIGFNGIIFKKIEGINFKEIIKTTPLDRILIETDCPYLTPPECKKERNDPTCLPFIIKEIAKIKKEKPERIAEITTQNAKKLFNLDKFIK